MQNQVYTCIIIYTLTNFFPTAMQCKFEFTEWVQIHVPNSQYDKFCMYVPLAFTR